MGIKTNEWKSRTLLETKKALQKEVKNLGWKREEEVNEEFLSEIQFLLGLNGWYLCCHMGKDYPYTIRFKRIGEREYKKSNPEDFITLAKQKLLH